MAPTRILLVPANSVVSERRMVVQPQPLRAPKQTKRAMDPEELLNPQQPSKPRKRERLTTLTPEEKMARRKMKNRVAAQSARDRKKERTHGLEDAVRQLLDENRRLRDDNKQLQERLTRLERRCEERESGMMGERGVKEEWTEKATVAPAGTDHVAYPPPPPLGPLISDHELQRILDDLEEVDVDELCASLYHQEGDPSTAESSSLSPHQDSPQSYSPYSEASPLNEGMEWEEEMDSPLVGNDAILYSAEPLDSSHEDYFSLDPPLQDYQYESNHLPYPDHDFGVY